MVLIGYSMGGILAKAMAQDSRSVLWDQISDQPIDQLAGPPMPARRYGIRSSSRPFQRFTGSFSSPRRIGAAASISGALHWLAAQLNQPLDSLQKFHSELVASNGPDYFRNHSVRVSPAVSTSLPGNTPG